MTSAKRHDSNLEFVGTYTNLGILKQQMGDTLGALTAFSRAIAINPKYPRAYLLRGIVRYESGNKEAGSRDLQQAGKMGLKEAYEYLDED